MTHITFDQTVAIQAALADPLRMRLVRLLMERELCVCELMDMLDEPQYKVSRHLRTLKQAGVVRDRREGKWMHYAIATTLPAAWREALLGLARAWDDIPQIQADLERLHTLMLRAADEPARCSP